MKQLKQDKLARNFVRRSARQALLNHQESQKKPLVDQELKHIEKLHAKSNIVFNALIDYRLTKNEKVSVISKTLFKK